MTIDYYAPALRRTQSLLGCSEDEAKRILKKRLDMIKAQNDFKSEERALAYLFSHDPNYRGHAPRSALDHRL